MPFLPLDAIATKIYDLLRQDARTIEINWLNGRRPMSYDASRPYPEGTVYIGPGTVRAFTMPAGEESSARIVVQIVYASNEGAEAAEKLLRLGIDVIAQVLIDTWEIGLTYAYPEALSWETILQPESMPPLAAARFNLDVKIIPGD